jgi:hypothetical protein
MEVCVFADRSLHNEAPKASSTVHGRNQKRGIVSSFLNKATPDLWFFFGDGFFDEKISGKKSLGLT